MKVVSIIQARTGSSRLPNKVFLPLSGKPILEHISNFLKLSKLSNLQVIATSINTEDDSIEKFCNEQNVPCFRGSSENVLSRFYTCAKEFSADIVVRITADDPIVDPKLVDEIISPCLKNKFEYSSNILHLTYPVGICAESFTFSTLERIFLNHIDSESREHVTTHILENPKSYKIKEITAPVTLQRPNWRLTVDYIEDYELMKKIFSSLYKENSYIKYEDLVKHLDLHPEILKINSKYNTSV